VKKRKISDIKKSVREVKAAMDALEKKPKKDPKAEAWIKANPWFGVDEELTAQALGYHEKIIRSGVDPKSDEYWNLVNRKFAFAVAPPADPVNHPPHYKAGGIETIDFIEAKDLNYRLGNVVKYISRAGKKIGSDPIKDLEKAMWYLQREINVRKGA
jgi:hypothetical protein